jgi:hypothetical protein
MYFICSYPILFIHSELLGGIPVGKGIPDLVYDICVQSVGDLRRICMYFIFSCPFPFTCPFLFIDGDLHSFSIIL